MHLPQTAATARLRDNPLGYMMQPDMQPADHEVPSALQVPALEAS